MAFSVFLFSLLTFASLFLLARVKIAFLIGISILLILFSGLRFNSGIDYGSYSNLYGLQYFPSHEYIFWTLSRIHFHLFDSFEGFVFVFSMVTISLKVYSLNKMSENVYVSLVIFILLSFVYVDLGFMRNSLSLVFFMLSLCYFDSDRRKSFFLYLCALLSHHSALFFLFIFLPPKLWCFSKLRYVQLLAFTFIVASLNGFYGVMSSLLSRLSGNFPGNLLWKIDFYINNSDYISYGLNFYNVRLALVTCLFLFYYEKLKDKFLLPVFINGVLLTLVLGFNIQFYTRVGIYLNVIEAILTSTLLLRLRKTNSILLGMFFFTMYIVIFARTATIMGVDDITILGF